MTQETYKIYMRMVHLLGWTGCTRNDWDVFSKSSVWKLLLENACHGLDVYVHNPGYSLNEEKRELDALINYITT